MDVIRIDTECKVDNINKNNRDTYKEFIIDINYDLPIPVTDKIDIDIFLDKIEKYGNTCCYYNNNELVGCIFFYANDKEHFIAFITLFAVKKKYTNKGIGTILLKKMIDYCQNINMKKIQLYTHKTNKKAIQFYKKNGFNKIECDRIDDLKLELDIENMR